MCKEILCKAGQSWFGEQTSAQVVSAAFFSIHAAVRSCTPCLPNCPRARCRPSAHGGTPPCTVCM